jgi:uncharacterized protein YjbI with pentapeptide repeats
MRRLRRVPIWGWFAAAAVVIVLQQVGWARAGRPIRTWAQPIRDAAWPVLEVGWPLLLAAGAAALSTTRGRGWIAQVAGWLRALVARRWLWLVAGTVGVTELLVVVVAVLPPRLANQAAFTNPADAVTARNDVRATLLQGLAGVFVALGLALTWRQLQHNIQSTREQRDLERAGQITERFTRAVDQLGAEQLDVRLGGIYALERIARDSPGDQATIAEILTAYVRQRSPWPPTQPGQYREDWPLDRQPRLRTRAPDVQAAISVLGRGSFPQTSPSGGDRLDLAAVDLRKANLAGANLQWATFDGTQLQEAILVDADLWGARLDGADLREACLIGAELQEAYLLNADLQKANLDGADLQKARLDGTNLHKASLIGTHLQDAILESADLKEAALFKADLEEASLMDADLQEAFLANAHLQKANLVGSDLRGAYLKEADLRGAVADDNVRWPRGFDPRAAGVTFVDEEVAAGSPAEQDPPGGQDLPNGQPDGRPV